ncbi:hypothetical protein HDU81_005973, partial [Chytriomyces hyalinus]
MPSVNLAARGVTWNPTGDGAAWAYSCDWKAGDVANAVVPAAQCGPTCEATSGCTHFTWSNYNGGTCWMKGGSVSPNDAFSIDAKDGVCGYLKSAQPAVGGWNSASDCQWALQCDFVGGDISSVQAPGSACSSKCAGISGCTHFAWTNANGGTCWMKTGSVSTGDAIVNNADGAVCGIMSSNPNPPTPTPGPAPPGLNLVVVNKCSSTIWPGVTAVDGNNGQPYFGNAQSSNPAGFELGPGASRQVKLRNN